MPGWWNANLKAGPAFLAFAILSLGTYLGVHAVVVQDTQRAYDNQIAFCNSGNARLAYQKAHLVVPLQKFVDAAVNTRKNQAAETSGAEQKTNINAATDYAQIRGAVKALPPRNCSEEIQK